MISHTPGGLSLSPRGAVCSRLPLRFSLPWAQTITHTLCLITQGWLESTLVLPSLKDAPACIKGLWKNLRFSIRLFGNEENVCLFYLCFSLTWPTSWHLMFLNCSKGSWLSEVDKGWGWEHLFGQCSRCVWSCQGDLLWFKVLRTVLQNMWLLQHITPNYNLTGHPKTPSLGQFFSPGPALYL